MYKNKTIVGAEGRCGGRDGIEAIIPNNSWMVHTEAWYVSGSPTGGLITVEEAQVCMIYRPLEGC
jgi:hypothetical protein